MLLLQPLKGGGFVLCEVPAVPPTQLAGKLAAHLKKVITVLATAKPSNSPAASIPFVPPIMYKKDEDPSIALTSSRAPYFPFNVSP